MRLASIPWSCQWEWKTLTRNHGTEWSHEVSTQLVAESHKKNTECLHISHVHDQCNEVGRMSSESQWQKTNDNSKFCVNTMFSQHNWNSSCSVASSSACSLDIWTWLVPFKQLWATGIPTMKTQTHISLLNESIVGVQVVLKLVNVTTLQQSVPCWKSVTRLCWMTIDSF